MEPTAFNFTIFPTRQTTRCHISEYCTLKIRRRDNLNAHGLYSGDAGFISRQISAILTVVFRGFSQSCICALLNLVKLQGSGLETGA
jgi:hypothetical protein